jgi:hypothetical protein
MFIRQNAEKDGWDSQLLLHNTKFSSENEKYNYYWEKIILMFLTLAIFLTWCLNVLLKIFYHHQHKKMSNRALKNYKSGDQIFCVEQEWYDMLNFWYYKI